MERLTKSYPQNVAHLRARLRIGQSFDLLERRLSIGQDEATLFYIDGFAKDGELQRLLQ